MGGKSEETCSRTKVGGIQTYSFSYITIPFRWSEAEWEGHGYLKYRHSGNDTKYLSEIQ